MINLRLLLHAIAGLAALLAGGTLVFPGVLANFHDYIVFAAIIINFLIVAYLGESTTGMSRHDLEPDWDD